jgi:hypothetical protein
MRLCLFNSIYLLKSTLALFPLLPSLCVLPLMSGLRPPFLGRALAALRSDWEQSKVKTARQGP